MYCLQTSGVTSKGVNNNTWKATTFFTPYQYGFIDKRSTTLQLRYVLYRWTEIIDDRGPIDAINIDFM